MDILLVPGFMLDADLWRELRPRLERYGRIVDVDTVHDTSIEAMADRAVAGLSGPAVVIGFSMGGYVARAICYRATFLMLCGKSLNNNEVAGGSAIPTSSTGCCGIGR